jgi:hypothetical protein
MAIWGERQIKEYIYIYIKEKLFFFIFSAYCFILACSWQLFLISSSSSSSLSVIISVLFSGKRRDTIDPSLNSIIIYRSRFDHFNRQRII